MTASRKNSKLVDNFNHILYNVNHTLRLTLINGGRTREIESIMTSKNIDRKTPHWVKLTAEAVIFLGATGVTAACSKSIGDTPPPATTSASAELTPGRSPSASNSAHETIVPLSPEIQAVANSLSPDKLAVMSREELVDAFAIKIESLDKANIQKSYLENFEVRVNALFNAAMTEKGNNWNPKTEDSNAFTERNSDRYAPAVNVLFGKPVDTPLEYSDSAYTTGYARYYLLHNFATSGGKLPAEYSRTSTILPDSIQTTKSGDGVGQPFSVSFTIHVIDTHDMSAAITKAIGNNPLAIQAEQEYKTEFFDVKVDEKGYMAPTSFKEALIKSNLPSN